MTKQTTIQISSLVLLAFIGAGLLWKLPARVEPVEPTEDSAEIHSVLGNLFDQTSPSARSAAELRERYAEEGYPAADQISPELTEEILLAFQDSRLYTIQSVNDGYYPQTVYLVSVADLSEVNYEYCGMYSPGLCLAIYERGGEQRILRTFVGERGTPAEQTFMGHIEFEQFLPDAETLLLNTRVGDGPGGQQEWWAMNIVSGEMQKIVTMNYGFDGDGGETRYTLMHATSGNEMNIVLRSTENYNEQNGSTTTTYTHITMNDAVGALNDQALELPPNAFPVLVVDAQSSMSGQISFMFRFEKDTVDAGKQIYEWANYQYDSTASPKLSEQQIP